MSDQRPEPLVPAEVDLRSFETMPLAVQLLRDSRFVSEVRPEAFRAGVLLWCASWHQVPAGSLPDNDVELAKLAGYGFAVPQWKKLRKEALQGFELCSDGRLYHREVAARALAAWQSRLEHFFERAKERLRKANKARAEEKPPLPALPALTFEQWNADRVAAGIPPERADAFRRNSTGDDGGIPPENALKGTERERRGNGTEEKDKGAHPAAAPPPARAPEVGPEPPEANGHPPTQAGLVCRAMRQAGLAGVNPGDPRLLELLRQGATEAEFVGLAAEAVAKSKGFAWVLVALAARRSDAAAITLAAAPGAGPAGPWHESPAGVSEKGVELGLGAWSEAEWVAGRCPDYPTYRSRVFKAAGFSPRAA